MNIDFVCPEASQANLNDLKALLRNWVTNLINKLLGLQALSLHQKLQFVLAQFPVLERQGRLEKALKACSKSLNTWERLQGNLATACTYLDDLHWYLALVLNLTIIAVYEQISIEPGDNGNKLLRARKHHTQHVLPTEFYNNHQPGTRYTWHMALVVFLALGHLILSLTLTVGH